MRGNINVEREKELWEAYNQGRKNGNGVGPRKELVEYYLPWQVSFQVISFFR